MTQNQTTTGVLWHSTVSPIKPEEQMTASDVAPAKYGYFCKYQVAGLVTWDNDSCGAALRKGKTTKVASVDRMTERSQLLGTGRVYRVFTGQ